MPPNRLYHQPSLLMLLTYIRNLDRLSTRGNNNQNWPCQVARLMSCQGRRLPGFHDISSGSPLFPAVRDASELKGPTKVFGGIPQYHYRALLSDVEISVPTALSHSESEWSGHYQIYMAADKLNTNQSLGLG